MIKWVLVYNKYFGNVCGEISYRVLYESDRLYEYEKPPKTVKRFIANSTKVVPYNDDVYKEYGHTYLA